MTYEKYSTLRYMASFSAINYTQAVVSAGITFLLANYLTVENFSDYRFGIICMGVVSVFGLFGAARTLLIEIVQGKDAERAVKNFWVLRLLLAVVGAALVNVWVIFAYDDDSRLVALIFTLAGVIVALRSPGWFDSAGRLRQHATILLSERVAFGGVVALLAVLVGKALGVFHLGLVLIASAGAFLALEIVILLRHVDRPALRASPVGLGSLYRKYHWVWYLSISNLLMTSVGQLALDARAERVELAYLGLAMQFAAILRLLMEQMTRLRAAAIAGVTAAGTPGRTVRAAFRRDLLRMLPAGAAIAAVYGTAAGMLIPELFGERYRPAVEICWVLSAWTLVLGTGLLTNRYVIGLGLQKYAFIFGLFWGLVCIALIFRLAGSHGALGYAVILMACHAGSVLCQVMTVLVGTRGTAAGTQRRGE